MEENKKQPSIDDFMPKTRIQFPDGAVLTVGTKRDDDNPLHYGVQLMFTTGTTPEPGMNVLLPPHSIDVLIPVLQDFANQARFIMGQKTVEYPPMPEGKKRKPKKKTAIKASHGTALPRRP
jgi:hypothetical protein